MDGEPATPQPTTRRGTRGASLVEFALILPVFVVLLFGMITGGIALSQQNSVKNAVREASRFAAVSPVGDTTAKIKTYLDGVIQQVENAATGDLDDSADNKKICAAFTADGSAFVTREKTGSTIGDGPVTGCFSDGLGGEARTQVRAQRDTAISAIFLDVPIHLDSKTVSRYER